MGDIELAHESELAVAWFNCLERPRRALCLLAYIEADYTRTAWADIPVAHRLDLLRAMRIWLEFAVDFSRALERAATLVDYRPSPKDELMQAVADEVGLPVERLKYHWSRTPKKSR